MRTWEAPTKQSKVLLIVDDRQEVRLALARFFGLYFEEILMAESPEQAERHLGTGRVELLLCDYYLGAHCPPATKLVTRWRAQYKSLERVAIMTGSRSSSIGACPDADAIFEKPLKMAEVTRFLINS